MHDGAFAPPELAAPVVARRGTPVVVVILVSVLGLIEAGCGPPR